METINPATGAVPVPIDVEPQPTAPPVTLDILEEHFEAIVEMFGQDNMATMLRAALEEADAILTEMAKGDANTDYFSTVVSRFEALLKRMAPAECPPWCHNPYCDCRN